ncbi:MAG: AAA family ATPase, partial [Bacteroidales bacterium]|nr:AAA family ATPase [Bacteroidales bacterium]
MNPPLAEQLRPQHIDEYIGQTHLMGPDAVLRKAILSGDLPSMILWGPPGVGKTTLAYLISKSLDRPFFTLSAVMAGVKDVREVLDKAEAVQKQNLQRLNSLFADEESAEAARPEA